MIFDQSALEKLLTENLNPSKLIIINESYLHNGHGHDGSEGSSHFSIQIASPLFEGLSLVKKHRLVNAALKPAFESGLHSAKINILMR